jgi:hypothetical protein
VPTQKGLPAGVTGMNRPPVNILFQRNIIIVGQFSRPLIRYRVLGSRFYAMGLRAPGIVPTLAVGTSTGGSSGINRGRITFGFRSGPYLLAESNPGGITADLMSNGEGFVWSGLPTTSPDVKANVIRGYRAVDGNQYRFAWERQLGATTVTENVRTLALGAMLSTRRGVPPYTMYAAKYHDRIYYFGDPLFPYRVWYSEINEPESVHPENFLDTQGREAVTAGAPYGGGDTLAIFGRSTIYDIQGYAGAGSLNPDLNMRRIDGSVGCLQNATLANIHERLWFEAEQGVCMYDGAVHFMMKNLRDYWRDNYAANVAAYETAFGGDDRKTNVYKLCIPLPAISPAAAPTVALANPAVPGGALSAGVYQVAVTFLGARKEIPWAETEAVNIGSATVVNPAVNGALDITGIPLGPAGTTGRRIYVSKAGGATLYYSTTLYDNTTTQILAYQTADSALTPTSVPRIAPTIPLPRSFYYIAHYLDVDPTNPEAPNAQPKWTFDVRGRLDSCGGALIASGTSRGDYFTGSCDGFVRKENVLTDGTDDGDTYKKKFLTQGPHDYFTDVGGNRDHGKKYTDMTVFSRNENQAAVLSLFPGDEAAPEGLPRRYKTIPARLSAGKVAAGSYFMRPEVSGEGLTWRYEVSTPVGVEFHGIAGAWIEGVRTRTGL